MPPAGLKTESGFGGSALAARATGPAALGRRLFLLCRRHLDGLRPLFGLGLTVARKFEARGDGFVQEVGRGEAIAVRMPIAIGVGGRVGISAPTFAPPFAMAIALIIALPCLTLATRLALLGRGLLLALVPAFLAALFLAALEALLVGVGAILFATKVVAIVVLARALLFEASAILIQHAKIMIRELEIIFGIDPVTLHLRVSREIPVLLEQLSGIAARTVVETVATVGTARLTVTRLLSPTAAPATVLTVVHQVGLILVTGDTFHHSNPGLSPAVHSGRFVREYVSPSLPRCDERGAQTDARLPVPLC